MPGCAKRVAELCKNAGLVLTGAGSAYPYHKDPQDSHLRIAPTYPSLDEVETASELLCVCVRLAVVEKLLADGRVDFIFPADYREGMELDRTVRDILRKMTITDRLLEVNNRQLRSIGGDVLPNQVGLF